MARRSKHDDSERQALLSNEDVPELPQSHTQSRWWHMPSFETISPKFRWVPPLGLMILLLNEAEFYLKQTAQVRAFEAMACQEYYKDRDEALYRLGRHIPEMLCKQPPIQEKVAQLSGLALLVRMGSATVGTLLLARIADRKGRRPVLIAHKVNLVVMQAFAVAAYLLYPRLPIWTICMSGLTGLVGGNFDLGLATMLAAFTDVIPSPTQRATLFSFAAAMQYAAQLLSLPVSAKLINLDGLGGTPEVSLYVSLGVALLTVILSVFFFPETLGVATEQAFATENNTRTTHRQNVVDDTVPELKIAPRSTFSDIGLLQMALLLISITASTSGLRLVDWYGLIQFPPVKFGWTISQVTNTLIIQAVTGLLTTIFVIPTIYRIFSQSNGQLVRMIVPVVLIMLAGCATVLLGFSATPFAFIGCMILYTFVSGGINSAMQTCIACLVKDPRSLATVMGVLSIAGTAGKVGATIMWPCLLSLGLNSKTDVLKGLPFFGAAGFDLIAALIFALAIYAVMKKEQSPKNCQYRSEIDLC